MRLKNLIVAAGGILYRTEGEDLLCALVKSARKRTWGLPKGKVDERDSSLLATAVREVEEETGCQVRPLGYAGSYRYTIADGLKMVAIWHMQLLEEAYTPIYDDIADMRWFPLAEAVLKLSRAEERRFLCEVFEFDEKKPKLWTNPRLSRPVLDESYPLFSELHLTDILSR